MGTSGFACLLTLDLTSGLLRIALLVVVVVAVDAGISLKVTSFGRRRGHIICLWRSQKRMTLAGGGRGKLVQVRRAGRELERLSGGRRSVDSYAGGRELAGGDTGRRRGEQGRGG